MGSLFRDTAPTKDHGRRHSGSFASDRHSARTPESRPSASVIIRRSHPTGTVALNVAARVRITLGVDLRREYERRDCAALRPVVRSELPELWGGCVYGSLRRGASLGSTAVKRILVTMVVLAAPVGIVVGCGGPDVDSGRDATAESATDASAGSDPEPGRMSHQRRVRTPVSMRSAGGWRRQRAWCGRRHPPCPATTSSSRRSASPKMCRTQCAHSTPTAPTAISTTGQERGR